MEERPLPQSPGVETLFIGSEIYRRSTYGARHPLAIPRVSTVIDLSRALGWLPDACYIDSPRATPAQLARFHTPAYIAAVQEVERMQRASEAVRNGHDLGRNGNPVFPEIFRRPATACGGSILAGTVLRQPGTVYHPAGGTHHGRPDRASGFCFFNDPVLAILALLDGGVAPIVYLDVDAHHGDGVQDAFHHDDRVVTISVHEAGRWPMRPGLCAGGAHDRAGGAARNFPMPPGFNDCEMAYVLEVALLPLIEKVGPQAIVLQCGADALDDDPMSRLSLSNGALWHVVAAVRPLAPRLLVLGGGGYNPWSVARCWTGVWGLLADEQPPDRLPPRAEAVLRALSWRHSRGRHPPERWFTTLSDRPRLGPVRPDVRASVAEALRS